MNSSLGSERRIRSKKTGKAKDVVKKLTNPKFVEEDNKLVPEFELH
jgi:hypothetical protein